METPDAPIRSTYGVAEEDEEFYGAGHWVHETSWLEFRPKITNNARDVFTRSLKACPWWKPKSAPQHNAAALQAGLHEKEVKVVPWDEIHPHEIQDVFLDALYRRDAHAHRVRKDMSRDVARAAQDRYYEEHPNDPFPPIANAPDYIRPLATEADAAYVLLGLPIHSCVTVLITNRSPRSELFCTNVALMVRDTLNELLSTEFRAGTLTPGVRVEIESQARIGRGQNACVCDLVESGFLPNLGKSLIRGCRIRQERP